MTPRCLFCDARAEVEVESRVLGHVLTVVPACRAHLDDARLPTYPVTSYIERPIERKRS